MIDKVRWGVLSVAKIGWEKVIPGMLRSQHCALEAIASRDKGRAQSWADKLGIPRAYGSYEDLLADPRIEAVYNPLPNHLHVPLTLAAARAGKHVLCEKPFALNANEIAQLREVASKVHIMEAFMVRFHPQWLRARELVRSGAIGELRAIQVFFSYFNRDTANIRNQVDIGGGALYDIGCYAIVTGRYFYEREPLRVVSQIDRDPEFGTDRTVSAILDFGNGTRLDFTVSTQTAPFQRVHLVGTKARLEIQVPFNAEQGRETRLFIDEGQVLGGAAAKEEVIEKSDQYGLQCDAFSEVIRGLRPLPYGLDDAQSNMRVIDAVFRSERSGSWETVSNI